jgi:hypothetical protein
LGGAGGELGKLYLGRGSPQIQVSPRGPQDSTLENAAGRFVPLHPWANSWSLPSRPPGRGQPPGPGCPFESSGVERTSPSHAVARCGLLRHSQWAIPPQGQAKAPLRVTMHPSSNPRGQTSMARPRRRSLSVTQVLSRIADGRAGLHSALSCPPSSVHTTDGGPGTRTTSRFLNSTVADTYDGLFLPRRLFGMARVGDLV